MKKKKGPAHWPALLYGCRESDILVKTLLPDTIDKLTFFIINSQLYASLVQRNAVKNMLGGQNMDIHYEAILPDEKHLRNSQQEYYDNVFIQT